MASHPISMPATIAAVVITRNRVDSLRSTLLSLQQSRYPLQQIVVSDDSTDETTAKMLRLEFPLVVRVEGPRTGRSGNRNAGIRATTSDFILMCDDDIELDPTFPNVVIKRARSSPGGLFFPKIEEYGISYLPNAVDFLGFSTRLYAKGEPYVTAHSQCFILERSVTSRILYDDIVSLYGFEEFDFAYRVAVAGFPIVPIPECTCKHLAPNRNEPYRHRKDANRLYVNFKRYFFVDRNPLKGLAFVALAVPHNFLASFKRSGWRGLADAFDNAKLASSMLRHYLAERKTNPTI